MVLEPAAGSMIVRQRPPRPRYVAGYINLVFTGWRQHKSNAFLLPNPVA